MIRYTIVISVWLSSIIFNTLVQPKLDNEVVMKTALLRCVNGYTFPVTIDNKAFVIHCDSYDIGE